MYKRVKSDRNHTIIERPDKTIFIFGRGKSMVVAIIRKGN